MTLQVPAYLPAMTMTMTFVSIPQKYYVGMLTPAYRSRDHQLENRIMSVMTPLETDRILETQVLPSRILPAQLRSADGDRLLTTLPLQTATAIGRAPDVGLRLGEDPFVSAHHAVITWDPKLQTHVITDTNSRNGIHVDDVQVTGSVRLADGARIRLGMTELLYCARRERR